MLLLARSVGRQNATSAAQPTCRGLSAVKRAAMPITRSAAGQEVFGKNEALLADLTKRRFFYRQDFRQS